MGILVIPEALRAKLGEEATTGLIEVLNSVSSSTHERSVEVNAERFEQKVVEATIGLERKILELEKRITETKVELEKRIAETEADLIKWMFVFWLGQAATVLAIVQMMR